GFLVVLLLQGREECVHRVLLRVMAEIPPQDRAYQHDDDDRDDKVAPLAGLHEVVRLGFEQGHDEYSLLPARHDDQLHHGRTAAAITDEDLQLPHVNAAVAGGDLQQLTAAVQLPAHSRAPDVAIDRHRKVERNPAIAGVGRQLSREVLRQLDFHAAIAGVQQPATGHLRPRTRGELDMTVTAAQVHFTDHAINGDVPVTRTCADVAREVVYLDRAVTGIDLGRPRGSIHINVAVAGVEIERRLLGHLNFDTRPVIVPATVPADVDTNVAGESDGEIDLVAVLMFGDLQVGRAVLVPLGNHAGRNGVARPASDFDGGVIGVDAQRRLRTHGVGLRPVLGKGRQGQQGESKRKNQNEFTHKLLHVVVREGACLGSLRKESAARVAWGHAVLEERKPHMPSQHRSLQENRRAAWEMVSGCTNGGSGVDDLHLLETRNLKLETVFPYRLYWFCFFSASRSSPNRMSRSINSA